MLACKRRYLMIAVTVEPRHVTLEQLRLLWSARASVDVAPGARPRVDAAAEAVGRVLTEDRVVYGVNTGFGSLARTRIDASKLAELQRALVLSHAAGTGPLLDDAIVRLVIAQKIAALARGYSGVRYEVIDALVKLLNANVMPCIPAQGSVGASGDLAPLAHLAAVLIGEGSARIDGRAVDAGDALAAAGIAPLKLTPKEGLALLNRTQVTTWIAVAPLTLAERALAGAVVAGALAADACLGSETPFHPRVRAVC